jgi:hypothetical protein
MIKSYSFSVTLFLEEKLLKPFVIPFNIFRDEFMNRGKWLHQTSNQIYLRNKRESFISIFVGIFSMAFGLSILIFAVIVVFHPILILFPCIPIIFGVYEILKDYPYNHKFNKFVIYENGYNPMGKPLSYYFKKKEYFISLIEVKKIKFTRLGWECILTLKNNKKELVTLDWKDIDGYIIFLEILKKHFPNIKYPDHKIIKKTFNTFQNLREKRIPKEEFHSVHEELMKINGEFV